MNAECLIQCMMGCQLQSVNNDSTYSMSRDLFEITSTVWNFRVPQIPMAQLLASQDTLLTYPPNYLPTYLYYNHQITARNQELLLLTNKEQPYDLWDILSHWWGNMKLKKTSWKKLLSKVEIFFKKILRKKSYKHSDLTKIIYLPPYLSTSVRENP